MTDTTQDQPDELLAELERLRANNRKLLDELKTAKARASASSDGWEAAKLELTEHKLHAPVAKLLESVLVASKFAAAELAEHYTFDLDAAGKVQMLDKDGAPVCVGEGEARRPIKLEHQEVWDSLNARGDLGHILQGSQASGGNAPGSSVAASPAKTVRRAQNAPAFGLR